ncbi:MAG: hypothetical protein LBB11_00405, partial [Puniceicoccales bacterium]|nr:hypothetical protein [Puniceicoccales bacterium]
MKEESRSLYVDHQDYHVEENEKKVERTHFIKAMSDVGFKVMMSDPRIAEALINELFISIHIAPVNIASQGRLEVPLKGHGSYAAMDYHA